MEHDTPPSTAVLRSGPLRLALIVGLTAVAVLAPLVSAVRTTDAQSLGAQLTPAPTPTPMVSALPTVSASPTPSAMPSPTPVPALEPEAIAEPAPSTDSEQAAPIVVVGPSDTTPTPDPVEVTTVAVAEGDDSCLLVEETAAEAPAAQPAVEPAAQATPSWFSDGFDAMTADWRPLAGSWSVVDGAYVQSNTDGYDLITELVVPVPTNTSISVDMVAQGGPLGGGIMIGQPAPMIRNGATIVDFTADGRFLRWGFYDDETSVYQYLGGVSMANDFDPAAGHTLTVEVQPERTRVLVDGALVGVFDPVEPGQAGLVASASAMSFDNVIVLDLDEGSNNDN